MKCQRKEGTADACESKASMYVMARGGKSWDGYFCAKHATAIVKLRMRLIKKYNQNVVLRPISEWDRARRRESRRGKKGKR